MLIPGRRSHGLILICLIGSPGHWPAVRSAATGRRSPAGPVTIALVVAGTGVSALWFLRALPGLGLSLRFAPPQAAARRAAARHRHGHQPGASGAAHRLADAGMDGENAGQPGGGKNSQHLVLRRGEQQVVPGFAGLLPGE